MLLFLHKNKRNVAGGKMSVVKKAFLLGISVVILLVFCMSAFIMPKTITLQLPPKQSADAEIYTALAARQLGIRRSDVAMVRVVKRSIDARRSPIKVNLTLEVFIDNPHLLLAYEAHDTLMTHWLCACCSCFWCLCFLCAHGM